MPGHLWMRQRSVVVLATLKDVNGKDGNVTRAHAFISYVREDAEHVDRLQNILEAAGIKVWRDTEDLWPGQDWKIEIRRAITTDSLVFIACFSENSQRRSKSYQNEELILAVEQMRLRAPGQAWLIPIRFADCDIPAFDLGAGRTLDSLQCIDLYGASWERGTARLVAAVISILGLRSVRGGPSTTTPAAIASRLKSTLLASDKQIELEELVTETSRDVREKLLDETVFPIASERLSDTVEGVRFLAGQADTYATAIKPIVSLLIPGCTWGRQEHEILWTRTIGDIANVDKRMSGKTALIKLGRLPALIVLYAAGLAAVHRNHFGALRAVAVDPIYRDPMGASPVISAVHPAEIFTDNGATANVLALEADGLEVTDSEIVALMRGRGRRRNTPVSDYLYQSLRQGFSDIILDDDEYADSFDRLEAFLGLLATDAMLQARVSGRYLHGPWFGRFSWRRSGSGKRIEEELSAEVNAQGSAWAPLHAGMFGGSEERAQLATVQFASDTALRRQQYW